MEKILIALYLELIGFCGTGTLSFHESDRIKHAGGFDWSLHLVLCIGNLLVSWVPGDKLIFLKRDRWSSKDL